MQAAVWNWDSKSTFPVTGRRLQNAGNMRVTMADVISIATNLPPLSFLYVRSNNGSTSAQEANAKVVLLYFLSLPSGLSFSPVLAFSVRGSSGPHFILFATTDPLQPRSPLPPTHVPATSATHHYPLAHATAKNSHNPLYSSRPCTTSLYVSRTSACSGLAFICGSVSSVYRSQSSAHSMFSRDKTSTTPHTFFIASA